MSEKNASEIAVGNQSDHDYHTYLSRLQQRFLRNDVTHLFTTDAEGLWETYLAAFSEEQRQYHNCSACRRFLERYGALVTIAEDGRTQSAIWNADDVHGAYLPPVMAMIPTVRKAKVTGVFLCSERVWGQPETGMWRHWAITPPASMIVQRLTQTAHQAMAERREDFKNLQVALAEFTLPTIEQALTLLESEALYRSEKALGQAQFLKALHNARDAAPRDLKVNVVWRLMSAAPAGFCHPRRSMIGTLLEDIAAGMGFAEVSRRFAEKMHPLRYQRPQAAPSAGTIKQAEKVIEQLGAAGALRRRFARVDELRALWQPKQGEQAQPPSGVFGHVNAKGSKQARQMDVPPQTLTWAKFSAAVLPSADRIQLFASYARENWCALVTAADPNAPPILQWDKVEDRNPVSWYVWHGGSTPGEFSLKAGGFHDVEAVTLKPPTWTGEHSHQGEAVILVVAGARETRQSGNALFPEFLKAEFHGIRSVIEAYSRKAEIEGLDQPHACGLMLQKGVPWANRLRVTSRARVQEYSLDRWD